MSLSSGNPLPSFYDLVITEVPWKIFPDGAGGVTKILARWGPLTQYEYGSWTSLGRNAIDPLDGHVIPELAMQFREQRGILTTPGSKVAVLDFDDISKLPGDHPFDLSGAYQTTGREGGGRHHFFDGSDLAPEDFPHQNHFSWGDAKANGFVPYPGSIHPSGRVYELHDGPVPKWQPEWTRWLEEHLPVRSGGGSSPDRGANDPGAGRNNELCALKGYFIGLGYSEEDANEEVLKANALYSVPLDERELQATVLRPKRGWKTASDQAYSHFGNDEVLDLPEDHGESPLVLLDQPSSGPLKLLITQVSRWARNESDRDLGPRCRNGWRALWLRAARLFERRVIETASRTIDMTYAMLAEGIGCSVHQASRLLRKMHDAGAIEHTRGKVRVAIPKPRRSPSPRKVQLISRAYAQVVLRPVLGRLVGAAGPERVSQRQMAQEVNAVLGKWEHISIYRCRQALDDLRSLGEWSRTALFKPVREPDGWTAVPSEWQKGKHIEQPSRPKLRRPQFLHACPDLADYPQAAGWDCEVAA